MNWILDCAIYFLRFWSTRRILAQNDCECRAQNSSTHLFSRPKIFPDRNALILSEELKIESKHITVEGTFYLCSVFAGPTNFHSHAKIIWIVQMSHLAVSIILSDKLAFRCGRRSLCMECFPVFQLKRKIEPYFCLHL